MTPEPPRPSLFVSCKCDECFSDLDWDEGFFCEKCGVYWREDAGDGDPAAEWIDDDGDVHEWSDQEADQ